MKKIFSWHTTLSFVLLLISASALAAGVKNNVANMTAAAFGPVALYTITLGYLAGFSKITVRRAWMFIFLIGMFLIYIETSGMHAPLVETIKGAPGFDIKLIISLLKKETPDLSFIKTQFTDIAVRSNDYFIQLFSGDMTNTVVRETLWDIPVLLLAAWAGWQVGRRRAVFTGLAPSIAFHGFVLNFARGDMLSLQVAIFALIFLMGINQKYDPFSLKNEDARNIIKETYSTIFVFAFFLSIGAGLVPSISVMDTAKKISEKDSLGELLGLQRKSATLKYVTSVMPREHLTGLDPSTSREIAFIVKTGEVFFSGEEEANIRSIPHHYWRWVVYDVYTGHGWTTSPAEKISYSADEFLFTFNSVQYKTSYQAIEKANPQDDHMYWSGALIHADQPFEATWRVAPNALKPGSNPMLQADMLGSLIKARSYSAESLVPIVDMDELRASKQIYPPDIHKRYLSLPGAIPKRVRDLAKELTINLENPYDKAKAIEAYLRTFPYTLKVPPPPVNQDVADYFLFDLKTGYCDYYATSMIVLARAAGLPARLVIGYAGGSYDKSNSEYVVREADAHSWVEVYFTGIGWVEFEPTANQPLIALPEKLDSAQSGAQISGRSKHELTKRGFIPKKGFPISSLIPALIIFISGLWLYSQGLLRTHQTIGSIYEYIYRHGKKIYKNAPLNETPSVFSENLKMKLEADGRKWLIPARLEVDTMTRLYLQETYSPHPITRDERRGALRIWRKLFWRLVFARFNF